MHKEHDIQKRVYDILDPTTAATTTAATTTSSTSTTSSSPTTTISPMSCDIEVGYSYLGNFFDHEEAKGQEFDEMEKCRSHCTSLGADYFNWWGPKNPDLPLKCYCKSSLDGKKVATTDVYSGTVYSKSHTRRILG